MGSVTHIQVIVEVAFRDITVNSVQLVCFHLTSNSNCRCIARSRKNILILYVNCAHTIHFNNTRANKNRKTMSIFRIYFSVKSQLTVNYTTSFILMMEVLLHLMIRYFCLLSDFKSIISMQILSRYSIYTLHFVFSTHFIIIVYHLTSYLLTFVRE